MPGTRLAGITAAATAAIFLAACSSSGGDGTGGTNPPTTSSNTTATSGASDAVTKAQAGLAEAVKAHTQIPVTEALPSAPPKGKTVVFLQCEQEQCAIEGDGIQAAAKAIGWNFKRLNFKAAEPNTLITALKTALQYHPVASFFAGVPQAVWGSVAKDYAAAGAFITENFEATAPTGAGVEAGRGYDAENVKIGKALADQQIVDSNGAPSKAILVDVPSYPIFVPLAKAYQDELSSLCPSCTTEKVEATLPQLLGGQLVPAVVSSAQRNKDAKYIVSVNGSFVAQLPQALKSAGLDGKFKIISGQGGPLDQQNVLDGKALATTSSPFELSGWQDVDMAIRKVMGRPIPEGDHVVPWKLLTKDNLGTPRASYDEPADYADQFKKLWKVG